MLLFFVLDVGKILHTPYAVQCGLKWKKNGWLLPCLPRAEIHKSVFKMNMVTSGDWYHNKRKCLHVLINDFCFGSTLRRRSLESEGWFTRKIPFQITFHRSVLCKVCMTDFFICLIKSPLCTDTCKYSKKKFW